MAMTLGAWGGSASASPAPSRSAAPLSAAKLKSGEYQLGASSDLTGPLSSLGAPYANGLQAYFNYMNSHGGINGHGAKVSVLDDASNSTTGTANVRGFLNSGDSAIFIYSSFVAVAAAPLIGQSKTPAMLLAPTAAQLNPVNPQLFSTGQALSSEAQPMIAFANKTVKKAGARVAIIAEQSPILATLDAQIVALAKSKKMDVVSNQTVPSDASTAVPQATAVAAAKPDVVIFELADPLAISAQTTLRQQGLKVPIISYPGGSALSTLQKLQDPLYYGLGTATSLDPTPADGPQMATFFKAAKAANLNPLQSNVLNGYIQAYVIGAGLKACGYPCNGAQLTKALNSLGKVNMGGLSNGTWTYSAKNHTGSTFTQVLHWDTSAKTVKTVS
jgi:branched-chain amino acid transport system substrate-binding protein